MSYKNWEYVDVIRTGPFARLLNWIHRSETKRCAQICFNHSKFMSGYDSGSKSVSPRFETTMCGLEILATGGVKDHELLHVEYKPDSVTGIE